MRRAGRRGGEEVEHEVAVGDGVDRVRGDGGEAELARDELPVGREVHAGQRAGAERQLARRAEHELEAPRVAPEHPEVREQVMREVDGLRALQVRVARHRPVLVALGEADEHALQVLELLERLQRVRAREHRDVGRDLVVARARRVELAADRADDLRQPPLDRHVDVLVVGARTRNVPASSSASTRSSPPRSASRSASLMIPVAASIVACARDCSTSYGPSRQSKPIERVELAEDRVLWLREARHTAIMPAMEVVVRTARPDDAADALLYESAAPYYAAYAGGPERARRLLRTLYPRGGHTASWEVCRVAEADGAIVGVLAAFPSRDGDALARRFVRLTLLHSAPWRVPRLMRHLRATAAVAPHPHERMLYVDALATDHGAPPARRRARAARRRPSGWPPRPGSTGSRSTPASRTARRARSTSAPASARARCARRPTSASPARSAAPGFVGYVKPR